MKQNIIKQIYLFTICVGMFGISFSAVAQIEEVVVTAQKRSESVQDVPAAVSVMTGDMMDSRGFDSATDLQFLVPNMLAGSGPEQGIRILIRGVGYNGVGSPGVAVHADGVYQPRPTMGDMSQVDMERVEVLRGPQGTLYGRNANAGVINFLSRAPGDTFEGYAKASYQNYDEFRLQGAVNVPVNERLRARLTVDSWERGEGYSENILPGGQNGNEGEEISARLRVAADLTDKLSLDLIGTILQREGSFVFFEGVDTPNLVTPGPIPTPSVPLEANRMALNDPIGSDRDAATIAGILNWDLGDWNVKSISSFQDWTNDFTADFDTSNISVFPLNSQESAETFTQEFNIGGKIGPVDTVIGAFYMSDEFSNLFDFNFVNGVGPAGFGLPAGTNLRNATLDYETKTYALFMDATWNVSDKLRLLAGARYSKDKQKSTQLLTLTFPGDFLVNQCDPAALQAPTVLADATTGAITTPVDFSSTTFRGGIQYDLTDNNNIYFNYSEGFKIGGLNTQSGCGDIYEPEEIASYEAGIKSQFFDNTLILNITAFYYDYKDFQVTQQIGLTTENANAPGVEIKGLELESAWQPNDHWNLVGNLSFLDGEYTEFASQDGLMPQLGLQNLAGNQLDNTSKYSANISAAYTTDPVLFSGPLTFRADLSYRSRLYLRPFEMEAYSQEAYSLLSAAVTWDSADERYQVKFFGDNLTDKDYYTVMSASDSIGSRIVRWGAPRQYGIEVNVNF